MIDLVLKGGKIVTPDGIVDASLGVDGGCVVAVAKNAAIPEANRVIEVRGNLVMPGFIDAHTHVRGMERSQLEDFTTGTMAAAASGVTTIFEMPITVPPTSSVHNFVEKRETAAREAVVNFALYGGAGGQNLDEIPRMAAEGAIGYKTFMHPPPTGREQDFYGFYVTEDGSFLHMLQTIAKTGLVSCVHAENHEIVNYLTNRAQQEGKKDLSSFLEARPGITEVEGISRAAMLAKNAGTRLHICHVCAKEAVETVRNLKRDGQKLTAETCVQYLTFTHEQVKHLGPYAKINPPIRYGEDRNALWGALRNGVIDCVATDHAVYPKTAKEIGRDDIWKAYMGAPGLDTFGPVMIDHLNHGRISLRDFVKVMSENVARIFGIYPRKGSLQLGADADIVVVDLHAKRRLKAEQFYTKAKDIALLYDGLEVQGLPVATFVRGIQVMDAGVVSGKPGTGNFVRPSQTRTKKK